MYTACACALRVHCMCTACTLHVHCMYTACALLHCMCTACTLHVHCMHTACALHVHCMCTDIACTLHVHCICMYTAYARQVASPVPPGDKGSGQSGALRGLVIDSQGCEHVADNY